MHKKIKVFRSKDGKKELHLNLYAVELWEVEVTEFSLIRGLAPQFRLTPDIFGVESFLPELDENDLAVKILSEFDLDLPSAKALVVDRICSIPDIYEKEIKELKKKYFGSKDFIKIQDYRAHGDIIDCYKNTREILKRTYL